MIRIWMRERIGIKDLHWIGINDVISRSFDTEVDVIWCHWYDITDVISLIWYHWYRDQWYWYEISWYQRAYEGSRSRISAEVGDQGDQVVWLQSGSGKSDVRYEIERELKSATRNAAARARSKRYQSGINWLTRERNRADRWSSAKIRARERRL